MIIIFDLSDIVMVISWSYNLMLAWRRRQLLWAFRWAPSVMMMMMLLILLSRRAAVGPTLYVHLAPGCLIYEGELCPRSSQMAIQSPFTCC